jgi:hypothetical protein
MCDSHYFGVVNYDIINTIRIMALIMNSNLESNIITATRNMMSCSEWAWGFVENMVLKTLASPELVGHWDKVFESVRNHDSRSISLKSNVMAMVDSADTSLERGYQHYKMTDVSGKECWVYAIGNNNTKRIASYSDEYPLGSVLAGIDGKSLDAARTHFDEFNQLLMKRLGRVLTYYYNSELAPVTKTQIKESSWEFKAVIKDLLWSRSIPQSIEEFARRPYLHMPDISNLNASLSALHNAYSGKSSDSMDVAFDNFKINFLGFSEALVAAGEVYSENKAEHTNHQESGMAL